MRVTLLKTGLYVEDMAAGERPSLHRLFTFGKYKDSKNLEVSDK